MSSSNKNQTKNSQHSSHTVAATSIVENKPLSIPVPEVKKESNLENIIAQAYPVASQEKEAEVKQQENKVEQAIVESSNELAAQIEQPTQALAEQETTSNHSDSKKSYTNPITEWTTQMSKMYFSLMINNFSIMNNLMKNLAAAKTSALQKSKDLPLIEHTEKSEEHV